MKLPNARRARIDQSKVVEYLLNHEHPDGRSKAAFFERFGFRAADWQQLADALRNQAIESPVANRVQSPHGTRYVIDGPISTPANEQPYVRTVWIADRMTTPVIPRLVTAYPQSP